MVVPGFWDYQRLIMPRNDLNNLKPRDDQQDRPANSVIAMLQVPRIDVFERRIPSPKWRSVFLVSEWDFFSRRSPSVWSRVCLSTSVWHRASKMTTYSPSFIWVYYYGLFAFWTQSNRIHHSDSHDMTFYPKIYTYKKYSRNSCSVAICQRGEEWL